MNGISKRFSTISTCFGSWLSDMLQVDGYRCLLLKSGHFLLLIMVVIKLSLHSFYVLDGSNQALCVVSIHPTRNVCCHVKWVWSYLFTLRTDTYGSGNSGYSYFGWSHSTIAVFLNQLAGVSSFLFAGILTSNAADLMVFCFTIFDELERRGTYTWKK